MEAGTVNCESCGRSPAREVTVRRHVGLVVLQQFVTVKVTACRPCGRALVRSFTLRTLWQGWWGLISFFFNWFVLAANANAWRRLGAMSAPSLSGDLVTDVPRGFDSAPGPSAEEPPATGWRARIGSPRPLIVLGVVVLGLAGWGWSGDGGGHSEAHGAPSSIFGVQTAMTDGPFQDERGALVTVRSATCSGKDVPVDGLYTHFDCSLVFDDGSTDAVVVHLLEGDELFFVSDTAGS